MTLLLGAALLVLARFLTSRLRRAEKASRRRAVAEAKAEFAKTGLTLSGNVLDTFELQGRMHDVEVTLENRKIVVPPGSSVEGQVGACIARVAAPLADQLVCKAAQADRMMGPLPTARRVRTGYSLFDARYSIFMGPPREEAFGSYRHATDASGIPWAQEPLLDSLLEFGLLWLRVQEGRAELVFPSLELQDVERAAALATAIALASLGKPIPRLARGRRRVEPPRREPLSGVYTAWGVGLLSAIPGGMILTFATPAVRALDNELICGSGDRMIEVSSGDGGALQCEKHPDNWILLHYIGSILLFASTVVIVGIAIVALRRLRARPPAA